MWVYFIVVIIIGTNLGTNAEPVTVDIIVGNHRTCTPDDIVVFAGKPLVINIEHKHLRDVSNAFCTSKKQSSVFLATFTHLSPRGKLMIHNVTQYMGRKWTCKFTIESEEHFGCQLAVRYRNRNEAVVLINNEVLYIEPNENTNGKDYDAIGHYNFNDKDFITITCRNQPAERRQFQYTKLKHYNTKGELIQKAGNENDQGDVKLELKFEYYNDYDFIVCQANGYETAVIFYKVEPSVNPSIRDSTHSPPESTTTETMNTTSHIPIISSAPANTSERVDPDKEAGSQMNPWLLVAFCCGAAGALALAGCCATQYVLRLIKHKRCNAEVNYETFSSTDTALPHPNQWNEPIYAEPVYQQSETCGPHYQNNLDMLYTKPIPKKDRRKIINENNEYAEVIDGNNGAFRNNYADIDHDNNARTGLEASSSKAKYSEVTQGNPTIDSKYDNVFENGRYVNAHDRTEYVEPAYSGVNTHKY